MSWTRFFRRARWDRERSEEIDAYLQLETDQNIARGMPPGEARAAARRKFGNRSLVREEIYTMNTIGWLDTLSRDARYSLRALRHNPTFTVVALATLAIGIGANTAVFSVVNSVLLKPLPYPDAQQLVAVWHKAPGAPGLASVSGDLRLSPSMYVTYAEHNRTFQSFGVWAPVRMTVTGIAEPEQVRVVLVSDGTLQALNVPPALGRWLTASDQAPQGPAHLMLGYGYWQRRFGGDPSAIGRDITVDARPREIVGVMPQGFRFADTGVDLIVPTSFDRGRLILAGFGYQAIARLKPGVSIAQASADVARMLPIWMDSWSNGPGTNSHSYELWKITPALRPLKQDVIGNVASVLWVLMATIGIVMLIACANVANLLLVRAEARQHELAIRAALGAGWGRIVRELLVESVLLGLLGGALGLAIAAAGLRLLISIGPANFPRLDEISIDPRVLVFTLVVSLLSSLLFGLIPAVKYAGHRISLASGGRSASHSRERHRTRDILVVAQVALALVLLVSSGLMIRTFQALGRVEPGFTHADQLETVQISIPASLIPDPERVIRTQNDVLDKLAALPGVTSAAFTSALPMEGVHGNWDAVFIEGEKYPRGVFPPLRMFKNISPGFFQTVGARLIAGRDYTWADLYGHRHFVIISENLAREAWGSPTAAIGKRLRSGDPWQEVIGVVQDIRDNGVQEPAPAIAYWPAIMENLYRPGPAVVARSVTFAIRSPRAGTEIFHDQIRQAVWSVNANLPVAAVRTMQEIYDRSIARTSFTLVMLAIAGAMALLLGIVGIYGVISYAVSQRTREIGIRLALGAPLGGLQSMFVRHALALATIGIAIGLAAAIALTRLMSSLLFGISPLDPLTYAAVPLVLLAAAMLASYLPARRASSVDPVEALRAE